MADAVTTNVLFSGINRYAARFTNISDGTGETNVVKIDISALPGSPTRTAIEEVSWDVQGFSAIKITWDHSTDDTADVFSGRGARSYKDVSYLFDPASSGGTGDVLFTTLGTNASGNTYDIVLVIQLRGANPFPYAS